MAYKDPNAEISDAQLQVGVHSSQADIERAKLLAGAKEKALRSQPKAGGDATAKSALGQKSKKSADGKAAAKIKSKLGQGGEGKTRAAAETAGAESKKSHDEGVIRHEISSETPEDTMAKMKMSSPHTATFSPVQRVAISADDIGMAGFSVGTANAKASDGNLPIGNGLNAMESIFGPKQQPAMQLGLRAAPGMAPGGGGGTYRGGMVDRTAMSEEEKKRQKFQMDQEQTRAEAEAQQALYKRKLARVMELRNDSMARGPKPPTTMNDTETV